MNNLTIAPGACFDAFTLGTVTVARNVTVDAGAIFALGCTPGSLGPPFPQPPCGFTTTADTVGGNITADGALTMYLDGDTIDGNVTSTGGGPGVTFDPYVNFPIKDNVIDGNLTVTGWQGAWAGALRNQVGGNVVGPDVRGEAEPSDLLREIRRGASVIATSPTAAIVIDGRDFRRLTPDIPRARRRHARHGGRTRTASGGLARSG